MHLIVVLRGWGEQDFGYTKQEQNHYGSDRDRHYGHCCCGHRLSLQFELFCVVVFKIKSALGGPATNGNQY